MFKMYVKYFIMVGLKFHSVPVAVTTQVSIVAANSGLIKI